ncbi:MAG TPA: NAD(P)H-dependent oxidoreductase [Steroidobacteraceae bacterium]|nr:NAD(P)H-dependent oxidoreductase [Steroidobacteraceae bacterium]
MTTLLTIHSSLFGDAGQSSRLVDQFADLWQRREPHAVLIRRNFAREPVPHLTAERFQAFLKAPAQRSEHESAIVAYSDRLIDELRQADVIALGLPMYNFGVPSTVRAYFDHIARAGVTFRYTDQGPEGLLKGKKLFVFSTRGGKHAGTPSDTETDYVKQFFHFLGIDDLTFVYAEGLASGDPQKLEALGEAAIRIESLIEPQPLAA